ncbi:hypothetical protein F4556_005667 [Kitasatospora gansuensis]|uniref:Uncharacterized protein n=1 Tax=Kitasatospora gansuensis TaxID=258050 RepID=A0A7W7SGX4_9ACTN|nr:hypothetical protein [Kitasatospora gansuensis]MBB4950132.1 hypothetical protein [Kitasatospora gansuensis]
MEELLELLDAAWDDETGFLGKLRSGQFDPAAGEAYVSLLSRIPEPGEMIDSRLVQLIWFAPLFMEWQTERAAESEEESRQLTRIATQVQEAIEGILGVP